MYRCKNRFRERLPSESRTLLQLSQNNRELGQFVTDLSLDRTIPQGSLRKDDKPCEMAINAAARADKVQQGAAILLPV